MSNKGFKKLSKALNKASKIPDQNNTAVPIEELLTESFVSKHTDFDDLKAFINESDFDFNKLESIDEAELDAYVVKNSNFKSWQDMLNSALQQRILNQLDDSFR